MLVDQKVERGQEMRPSENPPGPPQRLSDHPPRTPHNLPKQYQQLGSKYSHEQAKIISEFHKSMGLKNLPK